MTAIRVHGNATAEELAAVLAVVTAAEQPPALDAYTRWRSSRLAAVRRSRSASHPAG